MDPIWKRLTLGAARYPFLFYSFMTVLSAWLSSIAREHYGFGLPRLAAAVVLLLGWGLTLYLWRTSRHGIQVRRQMVIWRSTVTVALTLFAFIMVV